MDCACYCGWVLLTRKRVTPRVIGACSKRWWASYRRTTTASLLPINFYESTDRSCARGRVRFATHAHSLQTAAIMRPWRIELALEGDGDRLLQLFEIFLHAFPILRFLL